jgi:hypothetical protein
MLAPFLETIFKQTFLEIGKELYSQAAPPPPHVRWSMPTEKKWDCRYVFRNGKPEPDLVAGILQISEALGVLSGLPMDLGSRLGALFSYRNAMFHNGFEWPRQERKKFEAKIKKWQWPDDWFDKAWIDRGFKDEQIWLFYLSDDFISKTVTTIEDVLDGLGSFVGERRKALQQATGGWLKREGAAPDAAWPPPAGGRGQGGENHRLCNHHRARIAKDSGLAYVEDAWRQPKAGLVKGLSLGKIDIEAMAPEERERLRAILLKAVGGRGEASDVEPKEDE